MRAVLEEGIFGARNAAHQCLRNRRRAGVVPPRSFPDEAFAQFRSSRNSAHYQWEPSQNGLFLDWPQRHSA